MSWLIAENVSVPPDSTPAGSEQVQVPKMVCVVIPTVVSAGIGDV